MRRRTWILLAAALCLACEGEKFAEGRLMFRELLALRDQIAKEFQEKVVDVSISNGDRMTVKFINSPLRTRSRDEKQQRADAVANFVAREYKRPVSAVSIQFVTKGGAAEVSETYVGRPTPKT